MEEDLLPVGSAVSWLCLLLSKNVAKSKMHQIFTSICKFQKISIFERFSGNDEERVRLKSLFKTFGGK